ncbi:MAG: aldose 1-epimerase [Clostridia bacterium]|nr:aldose 1-epimerase [Clostridia bacterium]
MIKTDVKISGGGYEAAFRSDLGGNCYKLVHKESGADILRSPDSEEQLFSEIFLFGNAILFPPNRIRGGEFEFEGRKYVFPINEKKTGCHLHGKLYETPFEITDLRADRVKFSYSAAAGEYLGFPHAFVLEREYSLSADGMREVVSVTNLSDENMPFMLAFHTTFNAPFISGSSTEDCYFGASVTKEHIRDEKYLPTLEYIGGRERERLMNCGEYPIAKSALSAFYGHGGNECAIYDKRSGKRIIYRASDDYKYRMLWRKDGAPYFVCEPQTSAIDCFHLESSAEEKGLISIPAKESIKLITEFSVK